MTKNVLFLYTLSGMASGLCILGGLPLIIGPGIAFGLVFAFKQAAPRRIYQKLLLVFASCFIYYVAQGIAIHNFDYLGFLPVGSDAKMQIRLFSAGLFGAAMLWALRLSLGKGSINVRNSLLAICGGGITGVVFYFAFESRNTLGVVLAFTLWQSVVGVGLHKSFGQSSSLSRSSSANPSH
jgi:hypothetical protein